MPVSAEMQEWPTYRQVGPIVSATPVRLACGGASRHGNP